MVGGDDRNGPVATRISVDGVDDAPDFHVHVAHRINQMALPQLVAWPVGRFRDMDEAVVLRRGAAEVQAPRSPRWRWQPGNISHRSEINFVPSIVQTDEVGSAMISSSCVHQMPSVFWRKRGRTPVVVSHANMEALGHVGIAVIVRSRSRRESCCCNRGARGPPARWLKHEPPGEHGRVVRNRLRDVVIAPGIESEGAFGHEAHEIRNCARALLT